MHSTHISSFELCFFFAVSEHIARVNYEAKCKLPQRKLEYMKSTPNKSYKPRATVLYRCGNDTACCPSDTQTCVMKHQVQVTLVFQVVSIWLKSKFSCLEDFYGNINSILTKLKFPLRT